MLDKPRVTASESIDPPVERQRDMLAKAIGDAALRAGIWNGQAPITGPMLLMLCEDLADAAASRSVRIGINGQGDSPTRFVAFSANDEIIAAGANPNSVQDLAQDYAEGHKGEYVHLYQHAMSLRCADGD